MGIPSIAIMLHELIKLLKVLKRHHHLHWHFWWDR
jgi:hypothetical protein